MADIQSIRSYIWTSTDDNSGTDGDVYLGIGGREFCLDTPHDDFEAGRAVTAVVGADTTGNGVSNAAMNDPRTPYQLRTQSLDRFPVYLRIDGNDHWKVSFAAIFVYAGPHPAIMQLTDRFYTPFAYTGEQGGIWLGPRAGKWLHLVRAVERDMVRVLRAANLLEAVNKTLPRPLGERSRRRRK